LHQAIGSGSISARASNLYGREKPLGTYCLQKTAREVVENTDLSLGLEYVNSIACGEFIRIESVGLRAHKEFIKIGQVKLGPPSQQATRVHS
jgi:hypothetical protein